MDFAFHAAVVHKIILGAVLIGAGSAGAVVARGSHVPPPHVAPSATETIGPYADPTLKKPSSSIAPDEGPVRLSGDHLDAGLTLIVANQASVLAYGPQSLSVQPPTSLEFDPRFLEDGTYQLSVRNPSGRQSSPQILTVRHNKK